jgi:hypothetical protein
MEPSGAICEGRPPQGGRHLVHALRSSNVLLLAGLLTAGLASAGPAVTYRIVNTTDYGRSAVAQRADANTVTAALQLTLHDLRQYFGAAPSVRQAYEDRKDHRSGGATFTVTARGVTMKGLVTCRIGPSAANVAVVYLRTDAPAGEWDRLTHPQEAKAPPAPAAAPAPTGALRTYNFPDGTGFIGLAEGWSTQAPSCLRGATLAGPNEELVHVGSALSGVTPDSPLAGMGTSLVAPFSGPAEALRLLGPQLSRMSLSQGGPAKTFDTITQGATRPAMLAGGRRALVTFGVTELSRSGVKKHFKVKAEMEMSPIPPTGWMLSINQAGAPDATYERDLPIMWSMIESWRINPDVVNRLNAQALAGQQQWFAAQQQAHHDQVAAYDRQNQAWRENQKALDQRNSNWEQQQNSQARRADDFDELIRGYRTVEDTRTGEKRSVDLGNVDRIVDDLNAHDPDRYRQIPLRDETDPAPPHR